jgi:CubicO group peptidase (beta-lactamase class C family)
MSRVLALPALILVLALTPAPQPSATPDIAAISGDVVTTAQKVQSIPGIKIGIIRDGRVALDRGYGVQNIATQKPVDSDTVFEIGSITKQFTAAAILQLKEQGKLQLTDRLGQYVPEYALGKDVTIEQLLNMTSGIPDHVNDPPNAVKLISSSTGSLESSLALIKGMPLHFKPGTQQEYSNTNYLLLGTIVARVSNLSYSDYITRNIFVPAHMTRSAFLKDENVVPNMATGYEVTNEATIKQAGRIGYGWSGGAGSIISTAGDMANWDQAFFSDKIVSADDVTLATTPTVVAGKPTDYGFGWSIDTVDGLKVISHDGGMLGFTAINDVFPALGLTIIVLANNGGASPDAIAKSIVAQLDSEFASKRNLAAPGEDPAITARISKVWLQLHEGTIDRSVLTTSFNKLLTARVLGFMHGHYKRLLSQSPPLQWIYKGRQAGDGGAVTCTYRVLFKDDVALSVVATLAKGGKIAYCDTEYD